MIKYIDYVPRKSLLMTTFMVLAVLFALVAGTLKIVEFHSQHIVTVILYILCQFVFNLGRLAFLPIPANLLLIYFITGPNSLTFIVSLSYAMHFIASIDSYTLDAR